MTPRHAAVAASALFLFALAAIPRPTPVKAASETPAWNPKATAAYLDRRETWWQQWTPAQKDHGTVCISCHTTIPYAMARPALRHETGETASTLQEKVLLTSVETRVADWNDVIPFYSDARNGPGKTAQSHATEVVLNAVILANFDARQHQLRPITRKAFDEAWALQETDGPEAGGWKWQDFHLGPWESGESAYQGSALLLIQADDLPATFATDPANRPHLDQMRAYLRREYAAQPIINQLYILWASAREPDLLPAADRTALLTKLRNLEQPDGGWRLTAIATVTPRDRADHSPAPTESDGYATALAVLALEDAAPKDPTVTRGLAWLRSQQQADGTWAAASINKHRDPESDAYLFMEDAATAYAVLALQKS